MNNTTSILILYTGGTIGMVNDPETDALAPFDFKQILQEVPELRRFGFTIDTYSFDPLIDSSNLTPETWVKLAELIQENYDKYDGFVILHGTDTMAYTSSALSFMLSHLQKPVILTGSQLPIGTLRTDGKENLISAIEIAAAQVNNQVAVPEVSVFFENKLYRGNRITKISAEHFNAFDSPNYPALAEAGIKIRYNYKAIHYPTHESSFTINTNLNSRVAIVKIFPGMTQELIHGILTNPLLDGIILETYGAGNAPTTTWFLDAIKEAQKDNKVIVNVTQCFAGSVDMGKYDTGKQLADAGVVSGHNITSEAAVTKLMHLLGNYSKYSEIAELMQTPLKGEINE